MKKSVILFDLDGTIIDSSQGIFNSISYALKKLNHRELTVTELRSFIGPPLLDSFLSVGLSFEAAESAVTYYRELYAESGMYQVAPYPEIEQVLQQLSETKILLIATSKPEVFAKEILKHLNFTPFFRNIYGADLAGLRSQKSAVITYALSEEGIQDHSSCVMVGDRQHDILGATANGLASIGVLYGFGHLQELQAADALAATPLDLLEILDS